MDDVYMAPQGYYADGTGRAWRECVITSVVTVEDGGTGLVNVRFLDNGETDIAPLYGLRKKDVDRVDTVQDKE